ncbi:MAG TPA: phosphatidate cytidylyltransferase [Chromatiales bacterium]|nr:phosphatidate cytidylyltransferase [Kiloniellaceae bacterium]HIP52793.1 phosphatidate cytidylyltransferase [Chromatiales bacterium]
MLKQRIITALILVPLVVLGVFKLPTTPWFALLLAGVLLVGAWEWAALSGLKGWILRLLYVGFIALGLWLAAAVLRDAQTLYYFMLVALIWWGAVIGRLWRFTGRVRPEGFSTVQALEGVVVLLPPWVALVGLHQVSGEGPAWVMFLLVLIWIADAGAYFTGRAWGRAKLAPRVSPGKTREGAYGAMAGALVLAIAVGLYAGFGAGRFFWFIVLCLVTTAMSIVGDLFESLVKRQRGVKDSGALLPGHGGMLDRIDSLTAAAPVFLFGMLAGGFLR